LNDVAILLQLSNQGIDLLQGEWQVELSLEITPYEVILPHAEGDGFGTGFLDAHWTKALG
jgi:hypothetical protein